MTLKPFALRWTTVLAFSVLCVLPLLRGESGSNNQVPQGSKPSSASVATAEKSEKAQEDPRIPLAVARERAKVMHQMYSATLDVIHHHYFQPDGATLPARAVEDVFAEMAKRASVRSRWISVNTKPMTISHEPKGDFEKRAAEAIASGHTSFDRVEKGFYRSATAIPLGNFCVGCHSGVFGPQSKTPRFAGLVIDIPIRDE